MVLFANKLIISPPVFQLPSSHMDMYAGFGSAVVFNPAAGLIAVPAENYCVQFYNLFDDREISEVSATRDVVEVDLCFSSRSLLLLALNWWKLYIAFMFYFFFGFGCWLGATSDSSFFA